MTADGHFERRCKPPLRLVIPTRRRPRDSSQGAYPERPTRDEVRRGRWRQTTHGFHVPAETDSSIPEQRILEQSMRLERNGAVTGWASLRMHGAAYCDGRARDGARIPVPLISSRQLASTTASLARRVALPGDEIRLMHGVPCTIVERAVVDEIERLNDLRESVVLIDMVMAARLTSRRRLTAYAARVRGQRRGLLIRSLDLVDERSRSPMESRMRLVWRLDAGLPRPICNRVIYALDGKVLGCPDVRRADGFRRAGLEYVEVVAGDSVATQVDRMRAARERALTRPQPRLWTIDPPANAWGPVRARPR